MKVKNNSKLPLAEEFIENKLIREIKPGDLLFVNDGTVNHSNYFHLVTVPETGIIITPSGNVVVEGVHNINIGISWVPEFFYEYFWGLISFDSSETKRVIGFFSQGNYKNNIIHRFYEVKDDTLPVLINKNKCGIFKKY